MKITKRKDGLLQASLLNPHTGKRVYVYAKTEKEVEKKIRQKQRDFAKKEQEKPRCTLSSCIDNWFDIHQNSGIAWNTIDSYRKPIKDCKAYFGQRKIADILPLEIDEFIQFLVSCDLSRQTINLRYIVLCKTFDWAVKNRIVERNAARETSLPRGLKTGTRKRLTKDQVRKIKESGDIYANMLLYTGTRRCECLALRWEDIDFENKEIYIHQQVMWETAADPYLAPLKTKNSQASIPLLQPLDQLLRPHRRAHGFIFNRKGKLLTPRQFFLMWKKFTESIGEQGCMVPHQFRHEYISMLHDAGIDVKSAQALARHSKYETTMDIYTELDESANQKNAKILNSFLASNNTDQNRENM